MFEGLCLKQLTSAAWRAVPTSHWQSRCSISAPASLYLLESHLLLGGGSWLHTPFTVDHRGATQGMQDPETEAREPGHIRHLAPVSLQLGAWEDGQEPQEEVCSAATIFTKSAVSAEPPKIGSRTQTHMCFCRGFRDKKPKGVDGGWEEDIKEELGNALTGGYSPKVCEILRWREPGVRHALHIPYPGTFFTCTKKPMALSAAFSS